MNWFSVLLYLLVMASAIRWRWRGALISSLVATSVLWGFVLRSGAVLNNWLDVPLLFGCGALAAALGGNTRIERLAFRDVLTGLPNGAYWGERLNEEVQRAARDGQPLALMAIGVDRDKNYTDGNRDESNFKDTQRTVADCVRGAIRGVDFPCRLRDDEFALLLPETASAGARIVAERIRRAVEERGAQILVSIGVVEVDANASRTADEYLRCADEAIFEARRTGGNRVVFYDAEMHGA